MLAGYTMNNQIPIYDWWLDCTPEARKARGKLTIKWTSVYIKEHLNRLTPYNIKHNMEGKSAYGHEPCVNLLHSFEEHNIKNKTVAIVGSATPWLEAILLNLGNKVTTIEYNVPESNFENLECKDYFKFFENNENTFDAVVTFSSIEHSGLGRFGDPLDPDGDLKTMKTIHKNLKENGILVWGAPVGKDAISWNAHRVYGPLRLPLLFKGFRQIAWFGKHTKEQLFNFPADKTAYYQPVIVLRKQSNH